MARGPLGSKPKAASLKPALRDADGGAGDIPLFGHDAEQADFLRRVKAGRWEGAYLVTGREGIGRRRFSRAAAALLLCEKRDRQAALAGCGECGPCREAAAGSHPDLLWIEPPSGKKLIPVGAIRDRSGSGGEGGEKDAYPVTVERFFQLASYGGRARVVGIDPAGSLVEGAANALLKILEEPPPGTVFFLVAGSGRELLPTIRSRCQTVRLAPADPEALGKWLVRQGVAPARARFLARFAGGAAGRALELSRDQSFAELARVAALWDGSASRPVAFAEGLRAWAEEEKGKTKDAARARLKLAFELILFAWESPDMLQGIPELAPLAASAPRDTRELARRQKTVLDALRDLDANVFFPLVTTPFALRLAERS